MPISQQIYGLFKQNRKGLVKGPATVTGTKHLLDDGTFAEVTSTGIAASQAETNAGTEAAKYVAPLTLHGYVNPLAAPRAPRQGIISTGATFTGYTADNTSLAFGTNDLTIGMWVKPNLSSVDYLFGKGSVSAGIYAYCTPTLVYVYVGTTATAFELGAHGLTAGEWAFVSFRLDRDGNAYFGKDGVELAGVSIAARAAESATTPAPLYWRARYTGTSFESGTLGECFIAQGALTAAQVAAIAKAGTARGAGLTMYQHLVPSDSLGIGIFEDISGNANHALLGASGISTVLPIDLPADAPAQALVGDGSTGSFVRTLLNDQSPGTDEFALSWRFQTDGGIHSLVLATEAAVSTIPGLFRITYGATTSIMRVDVFGATTNDYNRWEAPSSLLSNLAGKTRDVLVVRNATGNPSIYLGSAGLVYDITNLGTFTSGGTAPTWQADVPGNYIVKQAGSEITSSIELLNTAPTLADFEYRVRNGRWHPKFERGSKITNTSTATGTHTVSAASNTGFNAVSDTTLFRNTATAPYFAISLGATVRFTYTLVVNSGATPRLELAWPGVINYGHNSLATAGTHTIEMTASASSRNAKVAFTTTGISDFTVSDMLVEVDGVTTALDLQDGGGYQPKNPRAENGSTHWTMSTTGIKWAAPNRVPKTILADLAASTSAQQITGASVIPTGWEILRIRAKAASGTPNIIIGNASGGTQIVTSEALSTSWKALTIAGGIHITSTANLWATLDSAVAVELEFDIQPRRDL